MSAWYESNNRFWSFATAALCLPGLAGALFSFTDYGIPWDEEVHLVYGESVIAFFKTAGFAQTALKLGNLIYYHPLFDVIAQLFTRLPVASEHPYETRHLFTAVASLSMLPAVYLTAKEILSGRAGFFAAFLVLTCPLLIGHSFINIKDMPFAITFVWAIYSVIRLNRARCKTKDLALAAVLIALCLSTRIAGALTGILLWVRLFQIHGFRNPGKTLRNAVLTSAGAYLLMLITWPYALQSPLKNPLLSVITMSKFPWSGTLRFNGSLIHSSEIPWYYIPLHIVVQIPDHWILLSATALAVVFLLAFKRRSWKPAVWKNSVYLLSATVVLPLYAAVSGSTLYDGIRHFLFLFPLIGIWIALSVEKLLTEVPLMAAGFAAVAVVGFSWTISDTFAIHPYQYGYYNRLIAGGFEQGAKDYEFDYWGTGYKELSEKILKDPAFKKLSVDSYAIDRCARSGVPLPYYFNQKSYLDRVQKVKSILPERDPRQEIYITLLEKPYDPPAYPIVPVNALGTTGYQEKVLNQAQRLLNFEINRPICVTSPPSKPDYAVYRKGALVTYAHWKQPDE